MVWVKVEDDFYDNPKMVKAGPLGVALWIVGLAWCNRNLTDGRIPRQAVPRLFSFDGIAWHMWRGELHGGGEDATAHAVAEHLVDCGLWELDEDSDAYVVHDFHRFQPSRREVQEQRKRTSEARSVAGKVSGTVRRTNVEHTRNKRATERVTQRPTHREQGGNTAGTNGEPRTRIPLTSSSSSDLRARQPSRSDDDDDDGKGKGTAPSTAPRLRSVAEPDADDPLGSDDADLDEPDRQAPAALRPVAGRGPAPEPTPEQRVVAHTAEQIGWRRPDQLRSLASVYAWGCTFLDARYCEDTLNRCKDAGSAAYLRAALRAAARAAGIEPPDPES